MKIGYDKRGNLKPYQRIEISISEFKDIFVDTYAEESSRHEIFDNLIKYIEELKNELKSNFSIWINGSFVTNKFNPKDIDIVSLIDDDIYNSKSEVLQTKFLNKKAIEIYKIDAYIIRFLPKDHKEYSISLSDLLYWEHWFSYSKKNRAKKRFPKGFIEIKIDYE